VEAILIYAQTHAFAGDPKSDSTGLNVKWDINSIALRLLHGKQGQIAHPKDFQGYEKNL